LTTKFTRCTASLVVSRSSLVEPLSTWPQSRRVNSCRQPAHRVESSRHADKSVRATQPPTHQQAIMALIKIYFAL
jgi:hypothetical protein